MHALFRFESNWWYFAGAVVLLGLALVVLLIFLRKLRRGARVHTPHLRSERTDKRMDPGFVSLEIQRMCSGEDLNDSVIKQMSPQERALFEVAVIDALNNRSREDQHRLRSALIKYGYDELCARRVMSEDLSNRVRACALLTLLRPQWRDPSIARDQRPTDDGAALARAARTTGPLDLE